MSTTRILVVDDNPRFHGPQTLPLKGGGDVEFYCARDIDEGIEKLDAWAEQGHRADIVSLDNFIKEGPEKRLVSVIRTTHRSLRQWIDDHNGFEPRELFWHSYSEPSNIPENVSFHDTDELDALYAVIKEQNSAIQLKRGETPFLRAIERVTGGAFDKKALSFNDAAQGILDVEIFAEDALPRLPVSEIKADTATLNVENARHSPRWFHAQTGPALSGYLAFSGEEIDTLRERGKTPIIYASDTFTLNDTPLLDKIDGAIILDRASPHIAPLFTQYGKTAVFGETNHALRITQDENGVTQLTQDNPKAPYPLQAGAAVSLGEKRLYPERLDVRRDKRHADQMEDLAGYLRGSVLGARVFNVTVSTESPKLITKLPYSAKHIGLLRSEQLFVGEETGLLPRVLSENPLSDATLDAFKTFQSEQLTRIFEALKEQGMRGANVRLLDAKLGEFEGHAPEGAPRGMQFAKDRPELYRAQIEALVQAVQTTNWQKPLKLLVPHVESAQDMQQVRDMVQDVLHINGMSERPFELGAMVESKKALEHVAEIAESSDFISFGTNDLTASLLGLKRGNKQAALQWAEENEVEYDPFYVLCPDVTSAMKTAIQTAKKANPDLHIEVCGEQVSGNYESIDACVRMGVQSISVQPGQYALSVVMAARAAIMAEREADTGIPGTETYGELEVTGGVDRAKGL